MLIFKILQMLIVYGLQGMFICTYLMGGGVRLLVFLGFLALFALFSIDDEE